MRLLERISDWIASLAMFAAMSVLVADVVARYVFHSPFSWSYDLISRYLMPALFFFALASTLRRGQHVNIDVVYRRMTPGWQRASLAAGALLSAALFAPIAYFGVVRFWSAWSSGENLYGGLPWPTWIFYSFVPIGMGLLVLGLLRQAILGTDTHDATRQATRWGAD